MVPKLNPAGGGLNRGSPRLAKSRSGGTYAGTLVFLKPTAPILWARADATAPVKTDSLTEVGEAIPSRQWSSMTRNSILPLLVVFAASYLSGVPG